MCFPLQDLLTVKRTLLALVDESVDMSVFFDICKGDQMNTELWANEDDFCWTT